MAWQFSVLVVANVTADSQELIEALTERADRDRCRFTLLVPAGGSAGRDAAKARVEAAVARLEVAGLEVEGVVGDYDPIHAVDDVWDPRRFDEIIVGTLPTGSSKWLQIDLPHRIERLTDVPVKHVVAEPARPEPRTRHREQPERLGLLSPLGALTGRRTPRA